MTSIQFKVEVERFDDRMAAELPDDLARAQRLMERANYLISRACCTRRDQPLMGDDSFSVKGS